MKNKKMDNTTQMPESFSEFDGEIIMSNLGHRIVTATVDSIKGKKLFSRYAGWSFNGKVWWQNDKWLCEVWCYHSWMETVVCDTLQEIMEGVSSIYGED